MRFRSQSIACSHRFSHRFGLAFGFLLLVLASPAHAQTALATPPLPFAVGLAPSYTLRLSGDLRNHGVGAHLNIDLPLAGAFGMRAETFGLSFGPSEQAPRPLALAGGGVSLLYAFDETQVTALAGVGAVGGIALEVSPGGQVATSPWAGALLGLSLRFPLTQATSVEAGVAAPIVLYGPEGVALRAPFGRDRGGRFPFQLSFRVGLVFRPSVFFHAIASGQSPLTLLVPQ